MDRRAFLRALGFGTVAAAAAATTAFDLEKLLWLPGEKTIVIPPVAVFEEYARMFSHWEIADVVPTRFDEIIGSRLQTTTDPCVVSLSAGWGTDYGLKPGDIITIEGVWTS